MSADFPGGDDRKQPRYQFDRHTPEYRHQFEAITRRSARSTAGSRTTWNCSA
jgi:hypothetical protein